MADLARRDFLKVSAVGAAGLALHRLVPWDKQIAPGLRGPGRREVYRGNDLKFIGMPVGGICAGQVYLGGDGRLWLWDIFNQIKLGVVDKNVTFRGASMNALGGANYVDPPQQVHPFASGFGIMANGKVRAFEFGQWSDLTFSGEYPIGLVEYRDPEMPVEVSLEAFSPFCPLDADDSGLPVVMMHYTVKNTSSAAVTGAIGGWMENPIGLHTVQGGANRRNEAVASGVHFTLHEPKRQGPAPRPAIAFEDWKAEGFGKWSVEGDAFGKGPGGTPRMVRSYRLEGNDTNVQGDARVGRLISPDFTIDRNYIEFDIAGGNHPDTAYLALVIDGKTVKSATGRQSESARLERFDVRDLAGKRAHLEIVDAEKGFWGQISIGGIRFVDETSYRVDAAPDFGDMSLALLDPSASDAVVHNLPEHALDELLGRSKSTAGTMEAAVPGRPKSGVARAFTLAPGESKKISFVIAWRFPNLTIAQLGRVGNHYATRFASSEKVVAFTREHAARLADTTRLWHRTWYDSTLPRWLLDRTMGNTGTLATMTSVRFENGRFYGWEGIGCCDGTCGHVWQYAQTVGRLFPSLERSVREMVDYKVGAGYHEDGLIDFRGEYGNGFAVDAQAGYVLRTLREHQTSLDDAFLKRVYPRMKRALEYLIGQDEGETGILRGSQHNTLDVDLVGPSSWLTSLYLAALRAGEEMAREMGDAAAAERWSALCRRGRDRYNDLFWNGEYFIQVLDEKKNLSAMRIGDGCEADQIMGQGWAHQIGLGRVVDADKSKRALQSLFRYNFLPDVGPFRDKNQPGRWYAMPGEPGLLMCTFPRGDKEAVLGPEPTWASMYFNECWTGAEWEAAGHMMAEGLVDEALAVAKAVHDRHHPSKRNPFNEVECSDHYARCMAVYGLFIAASGFEYHGPKRRIGFAPKLSPENFRAAFTAANGWGTYSQTIRNGTMKARIQLRHGDLRVKTIALEAPAGSNQVQATLDGNPVAAGWADGVVTLPADLRITSGQELVVTLSKA